MKRVILISSLTLVMGAAVYGGCKKSTTTEGTGGSGNSSNSTTTTTTTTTNNGGGGTGGGGACVPCGVAITEGGTLCAGNSTTLYDAFDSCVCDATNGACLTECDLGGTCDSLNQAAACQDCINANQPCQTAFNECANDL